jgi:microsomal dipeptidase-like Zn-dependent dipeptidase
MINHPTYVIGCSDDDIRELSRLGVYIEHSICMFIPNERGPARWNARELRRLVDLAGVEMTIFGSDLGLVKMPRPVEGYRAIVKDLLDLDMRKSDIRKLVGANAASLL